MGRSNFSIHCPACSKKVYFLQLLWPVTFVRVKCFHCKSTFRVKGIGIYMFFSLALFGLSAVMYMQRQMELYGELSLGIPILLIICHKFLSAYLACTKGEYVVTKNKHTPKE